MLRPAPASAVAAWLADQDGNEVYLTTISEAELRYSVAILPAGRRRDGLAAVQDCYRDFRALAEVIAGRCGVAVA